MNNVVVQIKISGLPTIFPSFSYIDKMYTLHRVIRLGYNNEVFVTEDRWQTITDPNFRERTVQIVAFEKYKLRIQANEYLNADLIRFAKYVYIVTQDGVTHKAQVTDVQYDKIDNTEFGFYNIEYIDINPQNYKDLKFPVNDFLESSQLLNEYSESQLIKLTLTDSNTTPFASTIDSEWFFIQNTPIGGTAKNKFFTELLPKEDVPKSEEQVSEVNGINVQTRSTTFRLLHARFYMKHEAKNIIQKYIDKVDTVILTTPQGNFQAIERIIPEISAVANDLYQVDIKLKYQKLDYFAENFAVD